MRRLSIFALVLLLCGCGIAFADMGSDFVSESSYPLVESFEDQFPPVDWILTTTNSQATWMQASSADSGNCQPEDGDFFTYLEGTEEQQMDEFLVSPRIQFTRETSGVGDSYHQEEFELTFFVYLPAALESGQFTVEVCPHCDSENSYGDDSDWQVVWSAGTAPTSGWQEVYLTEDELFEGAILTDFRLGFRFTGLGGFAAVDNVEMYYLGWKEEYYGSYYDDDDDDNTHGCGCSVNHKASHVSLAPMMIFVGLFALMISRRKNK